MSLKLELNSIAKKLPTTPLFPDIDGFIKIIESPEIGFFRLPFEYQELDRCKELHQRFKSKKLFFHVGIGGSSLGTEVLSSAFQNTSCKFIFLNNIDPDDTDRKLSQITNIKECLFYIVSKSGGTAETNASFAIIANKLLSLGIEEKDFKDFFVFCTDPLKSELRTIAKDLSVECLSIPNNVGGRFSVLSSVGIFPAFFMGIEPQEILIGAQEQALEIKTNIKNPDGTLNLIATTLLTHFQNGVGQTVLMPYSSLLRDFSFWFVQLWAESLGKKLNKENRVVNTGLTPIPAYGPTDQHSQVQLFMEGPRDKFIIFVELESFSQQLPLKNGFKTPSLKKLSGYNLGQLLKAELEGTCKALTEEERPWAKLTISELSPRNLGKLFLLMESLTALVGISLSIDPFDQPGVEAGKVYAFKWLSN